jgi:nitroimidazol reductase NimA-like FMN-containing flavoprotein (pyridoxamine 5'-phosphate oxidase superfamily)
MAEPTDRTRVRRLPARARYDKAEVAAILDEALVCHVGFVHEGQPVVIPTIHGRDGETLYLHGSAASRMLNALAGGAPLCVTATIVDGLVLARSAFHHSMNYRSVVAFGVARAVADPKEKIRALHCISERLIPGRWKAVRGPNTQELAQTSVVAMALDECSAKVRSGPPVDDAPDYALPTWAGELPLRLRADAPLPDPKLASGTPVPAHVADWRRKDAGGE